MVWLTAADRGVTVEPGLGGYIREIRRFPTLGAREEYMLARRGLLARLRKNCRARARERVVAIWELVFGILTQNRSSVELLLNLPRLPARRA